MPVLKKRSKKQKNSRPLGYRNAAHLANLAVRAMQGSDKADLELDDSISLLLQERKDSVLHALLDRLAEKDECDVATFYLDEIRDISSTCDLRGGAGEALVGDLLLIPMVVATDHAINGQVPADKMNLVTELAKTFRKSGYVIEDSSVAVRGEIFHYDDIAQLEWSDVRHDLLRDTVKGFNSGALKLREHSSKVFPKATTSLGLYFLAAVVVYDASRYSGPFADDMDTEDDNESDNEDDNSRFEAWREAAAPLIEQIIHGAEGTPHLVSLLPPMPYWDGLAYGIGEHQAIVLRTRILQLEQETGVAPRGMRAVPTFVDMDDFVEVRVTLESILTGDVLGTATFALPPPVVADIEPTMELTSDCLVELVGKIVCEDFPGEGATAPDSTGRAHARRAPQIMASRH
jgi:hypothetical protein